METNLLLRYIYNICIMIVVLPLRKIIYVTLM